MSMRVCIVVLSAVAVISCGGDDGESGGTASPPAATESAAGVVATTPATDGGDAGTTETDASSGLTVVASMPATTDAASSASPSSAAGSSAAGSSAAPAPASTGGSQCSVRITGDVSAEWSSDAAGFQAFVYGGWLADPSPEDASAFGLNCYDSDFNIVGFSSTSGTEIPMEPATYELPAGFDPAAPITADVALLFDDGLWQTTSGTLEIVEFDETHIRGTFDLVIADDFDPTRTAEVSGDFAHSR